MHRWIAAASAAATLTAAWPLHAQLSKPATPVVGTPIDRQIGPPAPPALPAPEVQSGPIPPRLTLRQALEEAFARSPAVVAAKAEVAAAQARARQAGYRENPELSVEVENIAGTGELRGLNSLETTISVNQRLDLAGRRSARLAAAKADLDAQRLRLAIAKADLAQDVREQFARAIAAREILALADDATERAREIARITQVLVDAGREPPLRAMRAQTVLARAMSDQEAARAEEAAARTSLASLLGSATAVGGVAGSSLDLKPTNIDLETSLAVRLARAERIAAEAEVEVQRAVRRFDPALGVGVRHIRETGDFGVVAGFSMPLRVFDNNRGNIAAATAAVNAALAKERSAKIAVTSRGRNAIAAVEAAERRVAALERAAIPEAAEALRLSQISYREGRSSLLELIDAQNAYTGAQRALAEARLELAIATAELGRIAAQ